MSSDLLCQVRPILGSVAVKQLPRIENLKNLKSRIGSRSKKFGSRKVTMNYPIKVRLPRRFYIDHLERDLPSGEIVRYVGKHQVEVSLDEEAFNDLISDAKHYAFGGMDYCEDEIDKWTRSLERSARRVYEILTKLEEKGK